MGGKTFRKISRCGKDLQIHVFLEEKVLWVCKAFSFWAYLASDAHQITRTGRGKTTDVLFVPQLKLQWKLTSCSSQLGQRVNVGSQTSAPPMHGNSFNSRVFGHTPKPKISAALGSARRCWSPGNGSAFSKRGKHIVLIAQIHRKERGGNEHGMEEKPLQHTQHSLPTEDYIVTQLCWARMWQEQLSSEDGAGV